MYGQRQVHCITHCDLDGQAAGAVVKYHHPDASILVTNYNKEIRVNKYKHGDLIYITDFSLSRELFDILIDKGCEVIWCDHHKSALEEFKNTSIGNLKGLRSVDYCGAVLTWMYFNPSTTFSQIPDFLKLINYYDLWQHDKDPRTRAFNYGCGLWDIRPGYISGDKFWKEMFSLSDGDRKLDQCVKYGLIIQKYVESYQNALCKDLAYRTTLNLPSLGVTKNLLAMAARSGNSSVFERIVSPTDDALVTCQFLTSGSCRYMCTMYSPDSQKEVLDIVKTFGGGGHPTAAGFSVQKYPINYPDRKTPLPLEEAVKMYDDLYKMRNSSLILLKYANRSNCVSSKVCSWYTKYHGYNAIALNHHYLPELINMIPTNIDCIDPISGDVADIYIGFVLTNSGLFRCCVYPTSTSVDLNDLLVKLQNKYMKYVTDDTYQFKLINGGIWWYQPEEPVQLPINLNNQI